MELMFVHPFHLTFKEDFVTIKGGTTQNVLAAITFDLKFSYVLASWEGSAHDSCILSDALSCPRGLRILEGKYYLADAGYGIRNGYITPYRDIVLASCIIHNHIMGVNPSDLLNYGLYEEPESDLIIPTPTEREKGEETREWSAKRDEFAQTMWTDYMARNIRIGKGNKEGTSKQFRWTKPMEHLFLEILAEEAQKGNKPSNTFKAVSFNRVVVAISERFQVQCDAKHVKNHLRTVKNQWQIICTIRDESGFGWDDNMKMITCDRATYDAAMMAHKKSELFLNKSIDHYDEMTLVVGKDKATWSFSRTFSDIDLDDGNQDSVPIDGDNEEIEETPHLYKEVMSMEEEGFDDDFLCSVFDYLLIF
ncbi:hypothetical protein GOBAR_AA06673 [Gossypium barbadense]|uniref:Myb/SANT-like domain-containing protein n=1 Tax=Gossypium barbadense TaxID=3634 RepID=A0A2P5YEB3_GOSBA|nr:hypothetical protein GOBAR_AA06673 [Gossypium barbadense]